jgi:HSP20 family molecular chaperone IbpA
MRATTLEMMHDHVRSIHRAVTGDDPPEPQSANEPQLPGAETVAQRFAELESIARSSPFITERVPPFSFAPPIDVIGTEREIIIELGVPGVEAADVDVVPQEGALLITGARSTSQALDGRIYYHTEMARGPFRRLVKLPEAVSGPPRIQVEHGVIRIRLARASKSPLPQA